MGGLRGGHVACHVVSNSNKLTMKGLHGSGPLNLKEAGELGGGHNSSAVQMIKFQLIPPPPVTPLLPPVYIKRCFQTHFSQLECN